MSKIIHQGETFDFDEIRNQMDQSLSEKLQGKFESDQDFFNSYLVEHEQKFGERFKVS